jgi:hypothetical protein
MKEIVTYGDKSGKYYEVNINGSYQKFGTYEDAKYYYSEYYGSFDTFKESEEDRIARLAREKAIERDRKIDIILDI